MNIVGAGRKPKSLLPLPLPLSLALDFRGPGHVGGVHRLLGELSKLEV